ncbi:BA14K family protein [Pseudochrobactrum sp. sp1633]|uniref:BA14K family protein n=1 Tax=Pseudochrobactrum sp. sp1633 TaxID=3036706 RepID=UPI0025A5E5A6|nr:BA14K family protein [Pseudochrobactrum sp. sp1633]MDM8344343.1 BA14K family protein [Pseudochrobactrum sp. sp1633]HWD14525.1 BA14K family protein [Pseudochrobactrum sp.]
MKKLISYFTAALTALTMSILSFGTVAQAQPSAITHSAVLQDLASSRQGLSQNVQYYPERRHYSERRHYDRRYDRRYDRPRHWDGPRWDRPRYRPYYRPYYQPQFRYYRPAPPRYYRPAPVYRSGRNAHINWCYNRYRSYRASDNTFQPNYGPRRQCYSPYI